MPLISVVIPVYGCELCLVELLKRLHNAISPITSDYELLFVNDQSPDDSWNTIKKIGGEDSKVVGIQLSKNFGQHKAIAAGLEYVKGEWIVVMDCDLQDSPEEIPRLLETALGGFDYVLASRVNRQDGIFKKAFSKLFYKVLSFLTDVKHDATVGNFGIYHQKVISSILKMNDSIRYFPTMVQWVGFKGTKQAVKHNARTEGESSYNLSSLLRLGVDIILVNSDKPLKLFVKTGISVAVMAFLVSIYYLVKWIFGGIVLQGYTSLILSIWLLSGIIIAILGIVGLYVGKSFDQSKNRPIFIVKDKFGQ